jgi:hypothetical protein
MRHFQINSKSIYKIKHLSRQNVSGLNNINNCPADGKIPEFMVEMSCIEFVIDIIVPYAKKMDEFFETVKEGQRIAVIIVEHLIGMVIGLLTLTSLKYFFLLFYFII